jgi:SAM-dependent methyltransferase
VIARTLAQRFARLTTDVVVRRPALWRLFRRPLRFQFEQLAPRWDTMGGPDRLAAYEAALAEVPLVPRRALDLGTGTGDGAFALARRFPDAEVVGIDLAAAMVAEATRKTPAELAPRVRFERADAARLPFADGGWALFAFSGGPQTPIYVEPARLRRELARRGFSEFAEISAGRGTALIARLG